MLGLAKTKKLLYNLNNRLISKGEFMIPMNPLRYPGGKTFLVNYIYRVLDTNSITDCTFYEPYAGSAAVSIEFLLKEIVKKIVIVEKDPLIYSFWKSVVEHTDELCKKIDELDICWKHGINCFR